MDNKPQHTTGFSEQISLKSGTEKAESIQNKQASTADIEAAARRTQTIQPELSDEHRDYLIQRHGTHELEPIPTMDPAEP
jgi:hypothetical protein